MRMQYRWGPLQPILLSCCLLYLVVNRLLDWKARKCGKVAREPYSRSTDGCSHCSRRIYGNAGENICFGKRKSGNAFSPTHLRGCRNAPLWQQAGSRAKSVKPLKASTNILLFSPRMEAPHLLRAYLFSSLCLMPRGRLFSSMVFTFVFIQEIFVLPRFSETNLGMGATKGFGCIAGGAAGKAPFCLAPHSL